MQIFNINMKLNESLFSDVENEEVNDISDIYSECINTYPIILSFELKNRNDNPIISVESFVNNILPYLARYIEDAIDYNINIINRSELILLDAWCISKDKADNYYRNPQQLNGYCTYITNDNKNNFSISVFIQPDFQNYRQVRHFFKTLLEPVTRTLNKIDDSFDFFSLLVSDTSYNMHGYVSESFFHDINIIINDSRSMARGYSILIPQMNKNALLHTLLTEKAKTIISEGTYKEDILSRDVEYKYFNKMPAIIFPNNACENLINMLDTKGNIISPIWASGRICYEGFIELILFGADIYNQKFQTKYSHPPRINLVNIYGELVFDKWIERMKEIKTDYGNIYKVDTNNNINFINKYGVLICEEWTTYMGGSLRKLKYNDGHSYSIDPIKFIIYREYEDGHLEIANEIIEEINKIKPKKTKSKKQRKS